MKSIYTFKSYEYVKCCECAGVVINIDQKGMKESRDG